MPAATELLEDAPPLRLKVFPLLVTGALAIGIPIAGGLMAWAASYLLHLRVDVGEHVGWLYMLHTGMLIVSLLIMAIFKYRLAPADYGLHWPRGKTYIGAALAWGAFFGVLMMLIDYAPQIIAHTRANPARAPSAAALWARILFEGVYVGPTEEIPFRGLLVTYLSVSMPGKLRLGRYAISGAGIIVAVLFALMHATTFATGHWLQAIGQQLYAFALGVLYAYWLENSRSVLAASIGHNVGDLVAYLTALVWLGIS